jgi:hypothetical protein
MSEKNSELLAALSSRLGFPEEQIRENILTAWQAFRDTLSTRGPYLLPEFTRAKDGALMQGEELYFMLRAVYGQVMDRFSTSKRPVYLQDQYDTRPRTERLKKAFHEGFLDQDYSGSEHAEELYLQVMDEGELSAEEALEQIRIILE